MCNRYNLRISSKKEKKKKKKITKVRIKRDQDRWKKSRSSPILNSRTADRARAFSTSSPTKFYPIAAGERQEESKLFVLKSKRKREKEGRKDTQHTHRPVKPIPRGRVGWASSNEGSLVFLDPSNVITRKGREPGTQGEREGAGLDLVITRAREAWGGGCEMVAGNARHSKNRRKNWRRRKEERWERKGKIEGVR